MTAPQTAEPIVAPEIDYDASTGIVTEKYADGLRRESRLDEFLARQVVTGRAHNINEARVQIGLAQIASLPASPDGAGNPTFTAQSGYSQTAGDERALVSVPNVVIPAAPAQNAPPVHHANWLHSILAALEAAGALVSSPAVVALLPAKYQGYAVAIGAVDGLVTGSQQAPPG